MSWVAVGVAVGSVAAGAIGKGAGKKKEARQIRKMPKYKILPEVFESKNIARSRAFGRDRAIQETQEDLESQSSQAIGEAKDITSSTSGLLETLASINANTSAAKRELAQDEATIQRENVKDLYDVNQMVIDEKDKAWRQNVFAPWEAKLSSIQQRRANNNAFWTSVAGGGLGAAGSIVGKK